MASGDDCQSDRSPWFCGEVVPFVRRAGKNKSSLHLPLHFLRQCVLPLDLGCPLGHKPGRSIVVATFRMIAIVSARPPILLVGISSLTKCPRPPVANQLQTSCKRVAFPVANPVAKGLYEGFRASHRDIEVFTKGKLVLFANVRNTRQGWFATGFATGNATRLQLVCNWGLRTWRALRPTHIIHLHALRAKPAAVPEALPISHPPP